MKRTVALMIATAAIATPALAYQAQTQDDPPEPSILERVLDRVLGPAEQAPAEQPATETAAPSALDTVLAADFRAEDSARDRYRHPAETLDFFRVEPGMTVAEFGPGGGWYTRVLAPYIAPQGRYIAVNADSSWRDLDAEQRARANSWPQRFAANVEQWTGVPAASVAAFESDEAPENVAGTVDRILIFRSLHGMRNGNIADSELRRLRAMLADDGMVGVVQHRAPETETWERSNGTRGYLKQSDVVKLFELNGFELVSASEINANPNDPASWERGVWTLPPVLTLGDENRDRYVAIGESDRMTLLFRKAR
ncbi:class I SAM-dependent methyltransferase [Parasphingopyxis algicola]|uniref:class I SAM-dependent methyltransferase n=1 Tax=Parasphingopyxis algicola TaxID=2026624 RepID=UPI0015A42DDB|nr:class I SAM-dependent methyltransferase [Parasphingopyxis algicola]QLC24466.1 class I SAM-dependent methyltransferase [Parasphingopyxis algicola]